MWYLHNQTLHYNITMQPYLITMRALITWKLAVWITIKLGMGHAHTLSWCVGYIWSTNFFKSYYPSVFTHCLIILVMSWWTYFPWVCFLFPCWEMMQYLKNHSHVHTSSNFGHGSFYYFKFSGGAHLGCLSVSIYFMCIDTTLKMFQYMT